MGNAISPEEQLKKATEDLLDFGLAWFENTNVYKKKRNKISYRGFFVDLGGEENAGSGKARKRQIYTVHHSHKGTNYDKLPLVLVHGYSQSAGQFFGAAPAIANEYEGPVYSIDMYGCGLSSRPPWTLGYGDDVALDVAEGYFIDTLEEWRAKMNFKKVILCGHSIGGYLSVAYAEKYTDNVEELVLLSPVGLPEQNLEKHMEGTLPWYFRLARALWARGWGPFNTTSISSRLPKIYSSKRYRDCSWIPKDLLGEQLYLNWVGGDFSHGGVAHCTLLKPGAYARSPLCKRLPVLVDKISKISFVYGDRDWMTIDHAVEFLLSCERKMEENKIYSNKYNVRVFQVVGAGHPLLVDNPLGMVEAVMKSLSSTHRTSSAIEKTGALPLMYEAGLYEKWGTGAPCECLWGDPRKAQYRHATLTTIDTNSGFCSLRWDDNGHTTSEVPIWMLRERVETGEGESEKADPE
jgi:pimeloyl-ACP methyl ester carboxylesterase